ncbi:sel1 repeat family protein [Nitrosospira lacus]|uniref:Sel1 repeat family protein n=1 Tax=Nitrosospira lacus TaxID=1288494 RepID=A0A1W6SMC4_9PROT|nr:tetratricopeptide repeat protein [Nitrosospira lacus]ARO86954.1 sel1 repeat family protein [Nitrosospira lacus]
MTKNKNIIIGLITGLTVFYFQVSVAAAGVTSSPIPINSPEAKRLLAPYEKLVRENPVEAERIKNLAIHQKFSRDFKKTDIQQFAAQSYRPEMTQLALIEYYKEEQRREKLEAAKPKPRQTDPYDKLSHEDKLAVSLAALRRYDIAHDTGNILWIHGEKANKELQEFLAPDGGWFNREAIAIRDAKGIGGDLDKRYRQKKEENMAELRNNPPEPDRANRWIISERNAIAGNPSKLGEAKNFYGTTRRGGVIDTTIANGGNDWCKSMEEKTGLPEYFKKPNQVMRCERVYVAYDVLPTLVLRDRPDISVVMDIQPNNKCPTVIPIKIQSSNKNDFRDENILGKVIAWAQTTVSTTCRYSTGIKLIGIVNNQIIYQGIAARANRWALSEIGGEESIFPAHINWSTTLNPITPTDELLRLGEQYAYGKGVPRDNKKAVELFHSAAEEGNSEAQYKLAVMLEQGHGISQDFQSAFDWYSKAAKQGHAGAKNNIGIMYEKGLGMPKNPKEAFTWYRMASWDGLGLGHYNLGNAYFKGTGVMKDVRSAFVYFRMAESLGVSEATEKLKEVETTLQGMPRPVPNL